jgi:PKD repeat protein
VSVSADDPEGGALSYTWNFGDGTAIQTSTSGSTTHTFAQPGNYTVQVRIKDSEWTTCATTTAAIVPGGGPGVNLPPQIKRLDFRLSHSTFGVPGETIQFNLTANDTEGDPLYITWNFGDGSPVAVNYVTNTLTDNTVSQRHAYTANRTYSLVAVVTDNKTGSLNHRPNVTAQIVIQTLSTPGGSIPSSSNPWINYGIPIGIAVAIVIAAVAVFFRRRRERKQDEMEDQPAGGPPPGQPPPPPPPS